MSVLEFGSFLWAGLKASGLRLSWALSHSGFVSLEFGASCSLGFWAFLIVAGFAGFDLPGRGLMLGV